MTILNTSNVTMQAKHKKSLKVALPGMDGRTQKTLAMFLQGPCKSADVVIVDESDSELDIIDFDLPSGKPLLEKITLNGSSRPVIVLSLKECTFDNPETVLFLKKPVDRESMLAVLDKAKACISNKNKPSPFTKHLNAISETRQDQPITPVESYVKNEIIEPPALKRYSPDLSDRNKTSKHKTAMQMDEKGFAAYMAIASTLDIAKPAELKLAVYDPRDYFQSYVQSAFKVAWTRGQVLELNSGWKQLLIFPHSNEVWLDADDKQLRAFSGIIINKNTDSRKSMSVIPVGPESAVNRDLDKFQSMDALVWKLACWTSKGRYPAQVDIDQPVFLKHWPNFTRLLVTPHAMRIAALLIESPRTVVDIAHTLKIRPEYVFIFISAASSIGLLGQAIRNADIVVVPEKIKPDKKHSLFSRIINKLRANKE